MGEWKASLRVYLEVAKSAVGNAEYLAQTADCLLKAGFLGPAAALGIIGQEETGKGLLYTMIGFGLVPDDAVPAALRHARDHRSKQVLGCLGHVLARIVPSIREHIDGIPDGLEVREESIRPLISMLVSVVVDLAHAFFTEHPDFEDRLTSITDARTLEELKHRGLYVDIEEGDSTQRGRITAEQVSSVLADLRLSLEGVRIFTQVSEFPDEGVRFTRALIDPHLQFAKGTDP